MQWTQASLPVKMCGLGIQKASSLALPAFLASAASTLHLQTLILTSILVTRIARHSTINDIIHRSLSKAGIPSIKEPRGLLRADGRRPDGLTMIPWHSGRHLVWDATVVDTLASSYIQATAAMAGAADEIATERKNAKYSAFLNTHVFIPLPMETIGPINVTGQNFLRDLDRKLTMSTGDNQETCFLLQRLSINIGYNVLIRLLSVALCLNKI